MVTLEDIKERYPEGCMIACVLDDDKVIVNYNKIRYNGFWYYIITDHSNINYYLHSEANGFAKITKPAPESKQDKPKRYKDKEVHGMDVIDLAKYWNLNFNEGNILKYLLRDKGQDAEDMQKIADYAQREHKYLNNKNK